MTKPSGSGSRLTLSNAWKRVWFSFWIALLLVGTGFQHANALVRIDFEQKYFVHPGRQVWDFSIVRPDSVFHIYYHTIHESTPHASQADTIWHATSLDLKHWEIQGPVITVNQGMWDQSAIWAPDVIRDDENDRWVMAYTGCDNNFNQRMCLAFSDDLAVWTKAGFNPTIEPDTSLYVWNPEGQWSDFRDPFVYRQDDLWHILVTAKKDLGATTGVLYHATSVDLETWTDQGPIFTNDGVQPWRVLESPQYHVLGDYHHLLFGEFDTPGITLLSATQAQDWTMADRQTLDYGYAPELKQFDPGIWILGRLAPFYYPAQTDLAYVVRFDTLRTAPDGSAPYVYKPAPLAEDWDVVTGTANLGNPVFQDNPLWRQEPSVGLMGHGYYGSNEYYQGPLSGRGSPGVQLGDATTGVLKSHPFQIEGNRMRLLVGGGDYPATCYVALVDLKNEEVLFSETGQGIGLMTLREWDLTHHLGKTCYVTIVDQETGPFGRINVDEIVEYQYIPDPSGVGPDDLPVPGVLDHRAYPNPFNPTTSIQFLLRSPGPARILIHDVMGRRVWTSRSITGRAGVNEIAWDGRDAGGSPVPAGTYLYSIEISGQESANGKLSLVK